MIPSYLGSGVLKFEEGWKRYINLVSSFNRVMSSPTHKRGSPRHTQYLPSPHYACEGDDCDQERWTSKEVRIAYCLQLERAAGCVTTWFSNPHSPMPLLQNERDMYTASPLARNTWSAWPSRGRRGLSAADLSEVALRSKLGSPLIMRRRSLWMSEGWSYA